MKLAAIDIGTNAIRLQVVTVFEENKLVSFKKLEFLRFPLRLGKDVFAKGKISKYTEARFSKLMHTFKLLIELYEVDGYKAVATSAMREAKNGQGIRNSISEKYDLNIEIISGTDEARILNKAIIPFLGNGQYIHVDVGGGSTELNLFEDKKHIKGKSFNIGSVRKLSSKERTKVFDQMTGWLKKSKLSDSKNVVGIGTGGNINKLYKIANKSNDLSLSLAELKALRAYVKAFSLKDRISILKMNSDRADVIVPASEIYIHVLKYLKSDHILVPRVGLKDGLIYECYEEVAHKRLKEIEFLEEY